LPEDNPFNDGDLSLGEYELISAAVYAMAVNCDCGKCGPMILGFDGERSDGGPVRMILDLPMAAKLVEMMATFVAESVKE